MAAEPLRTVEAHRDREIPACAIGGGEVDRGDRVIHEGDQTSVEELRLDPVVVAFVDDQRLGEQDRCTCPVEQSDLDVSVPGIGHGQPRIESWSWSWMVVTAGRPAPGQSRR